MFRGIDPSGLEGLAHALEARANTVRYEARVAIDLLARHREGAAAAMTASTVHRLGLWSLDSGETLRWRADTIRRGQNTGADVIRIARARFAAEGVFSARDMEETFRRWLEETSASHRRLAEVVTSISDWLHQGWTDWDVTNDDLHNIWRTLEQLSAKELDSVIAALAPRQLTRWVEEMGNAVNGLSRDEKQDIFSLLAANSSGRSLSKVHAAILAGGGLEEAIDFGTAIRNGAPVPEVVDFVTYTLDQHLSADEYSTIAPVLAAGRIEDSAAIDAMRFLADGDTVRLIVLDSLAATTTADWDATTPSPLQSLVDTIARGSDALLKADAFAALVTMATESAPQPREQLQSRHPAVGAMPRNQLGTVTLRAAEQDLRAAATTTLMSDTAGIVEQLAIRRDPKGQLTTDYLHTLIDHDEIGQLGRVVDRLRGGDVVDAATFSSPGDNSDYQYPNAQNLGFLAGSLGSALERYVDEASSQIDWINWGAKLTTTAIGVSFMKAMESLEIAGVALEGAIEWLGADYWPSRTKRGIKEGLEDLLGTISSRLQPLPQIGSPHLEGALRWWDFRYDMVRSR